MQETTTQPQAFYTKPGMTVTPVSGQLPQTPMVPKKGGKVKTKQVLAVAGLVLFLIIAIMGVLIAQRQLAKPGEEVTPVAPTAPVSEPSAVTYQPNNCVTLFAVPEPFAECDTKVALTNFTGSGGTPIVAGTAFNAGDEFVFSILVKKQSAGVAENIKLIDTLPNSLSFVSGPTNPPYTLTNNGQTVTAVIPEISTTAGIRVEFKVAVNQGNYGSHTNSASVENLDQERPDKICSYNFSTVEGITECIDKTMYDLQGKLITNGGALIRGQQYEYRVKVKATNRSLGEVKVHDIIPEELEYVKPAVGSEKYITNNPAGGILIANFGVLEDEEATVGFIVKVPENIEPTEFTNIAHVYAMPLTSKQPEPPTNADECSIKHTILPVGTAECVEKEAFTDFDGTQIASGAEITPGNEFVYKVTVTAKQTTTGSVTVVDALHSDLTFIQDSGNTQGVTYNSSTREVSIDLGVLQTGQTKVVEFKVQLAANPQSTTFNNIATITTNNSTKHTCELPLKIKKTYSCNSTCETNANCTTIGAGYICYNTGSGKFCRLDSNPSNTSCQPATPTPTPTPTPAPGCNETCVQNADCSNVNHVCVTTADGSNKCRLADYPDSTTCTAPGQPALPPELPQTGPEDWLKWLKAGLVTLGIGTALFLLL